MLNQTKRFMRDNDLMYKKEYIRPMMTPKHRLNNRVIIRYSHTWTGRLRINEIDVRLHHQHHPRIFRTEADLIEYLKSHFAQKDDEENPSQPVNFGNEK